MILRLRDMTIIIVGILSMSFYALGVGLATASWMIYAALAPGCVHGLLNPLTYAFMARVVEPNEVQALCYVPRVHRSTRQLYTV